MIGDGAGVQLLRDDGRYDSITYKHVDDERSAALGRVLEHVGQLPDDDFSTALAASRRPIVLAGDGVEPLAGGEHQVHAAVLCPVIVDNTYAGYLVLTRESPGSFYSTAEVELARQYLALVDRYAMAVDVTAREGDMDEDVAADALDAMVSRLSGN